jgi:hypothetical protein
VILVGEIRDRETARIAMQASLTGHLVFATLHTNDAVGAITRLLDMEIPPYLIASSLSGVLAQRLVQVLCPACKVPAKPECHGLGAVGRIGVFELVTVTPKLRSLIITRASEAELREAAHSDDFPSMFQDGLVKVADGQVAYDELMRVTEPDRPRADELPADPAPAPPADPGAGPAQSHPAELNRRAAGAQYPVCEIMLRTAAAQGRGRRARTTPQGSREPVPAPWERTARARMEPSRNGASR